MRLIVALLLMGLIGYRAFTQVGIWKSRFEVTQVDSTAANNPKKNIEDVRVGSRVVAANPQRTIFNEASRSEPDWSTWLHLSLELARVDEARLDIELLRPEQWFVNHVRVPSRLLNDDPFLVVNLDLSEFSACGYARLTRLKVCPPIVDGPGEVVTGTFRHTASEVLDLAIVEDDGLEAAIEVLSTTFGHPFWSQDRKQYVAAGELVVGERLLTYSGDTKRIKSKLPRPGPHVVYNLEVHHEHVYFVGQDGILVHNACEVPSGNHESLSASRDKLGDDVQLHHLNMHGIYGQAPARGTGQPIPYGQGAVIPVQGHAMATGSQHYLLHEEIEKFQARSRQQFLETGMHSTNGDYGQMIFLALRKLGLSAKNAWKFADSAGRQRVKHGFLDHLEIPRYANPVPGVKF